MLIDRRWRQRIAALLMVCAFALPLAAYAQDNSNNFESVFSRSVVRERILKLLFETEAASTQEMQADLAAYPAYFMPMRNGIHVGFVGNPNEIDVFAQTTARTMKLFRDSADLRLSDAIPVNVVIVVDHDPVGALLSALPPAMKEVLLAEGSEFGKLSKTINSEGASCNALQQYSQYGALESVYVLVKTEGDNTHFESCIADMAPLILGFRYEPSSLAKLNKSNLQTIILNALSAHILYSMPGIQNSNGAFGVSTEMIDAALDRFYRSISE